LNGPADVCIAIRRASRVVTHLYELVLSPCGLKATQFVILQAIAQTGKITQAQLAEQYGLSPETLSRRLATLRRSGLVELKAFARGGGRSYRLTATGLNQLQIAFPYWRRAQERLRTALELPLWEAALASANQIVAAARAAERARTANHNPRAEPLADPPATDSGSSYNPA
jgi:DNA-binding MarR family transcriptional regulator